MDDGEQRRSEQERFVEEVGIWMEQEGFPRMAGRILGWLLICDPPRQSAAELAEALRASRGSISTMTQFLIRLGMVDKIGVPGERHDHFEIRPNAVTYMLDQEIRLIRSLRQTLEKGLRLVADQPPEHQERLREMDSLFGFFEREFPALLERWQYERETRSAAAQSVS